MKYYYIMLIAVLLSGCMVRSSILPMGDNTYLLIRSEKTFTGATVKASALDESRKFCNSKGKSIEILGASEKGMVVFTSDPKSEVSFKCVNKK